MKYIGKYEILGLLGRGGMGCVYKARAPVLDKIVALKLCRPTEHLLGTHGADAIKEQFTREARIMAGLRHPHIAQVWDFDEHEGWPFFIMEYACNNLGAAIGESYRVEELTRRLRPDVATRYALQTLEGLGRMHHAGIIHRDIKPYNLLITDLGRIKVIDFGLSKLRGEAAKGEKSNVKIGTPYYAPPEQESDPDNVDLHADLYAVAVILYRLLTGELPYDHDNDYAPAMDNVRACALVEELESPWDMFFRKALHKEPLQRFESATDMAAELEGLLEAWKESMDQVCRLEDDFLNGSDFFGNFSGDFAGNLAGKSGENIGADSIKSTDVERVRSTCVKTGPQDAHQAFTLDELARPYEVRENVFLPYDLGVVEDARHGLAWEQSGSCYPMTWEEAHAYVHGLNHKKYANISIWRLPTVDELATLVRSTSTTGDFCAAQVFDAKQRILWSGDRRTFISAWHLNANLGFVGWQDLTCYFWVRAVASI